MATSSVWEIQVDIKNATMAELNGAEITAQVRELANQVAEYARSIAPVGDAATDPQAGQYRDSIQVKPMPGIGPVFRVYSDDRKAAWIEYGTKAGPHHGATPEFAIFAKAAKHFGGTSQSSDAA